MRTAVAVLTTSYRKATEVRTPTDGAHGGASRLDRVAFGRLSLWLTMSLVATAALPVTAMAQRVPPDARTESGSRLSDAPEVQVTSTSSGDDDCAG